MPQIEVNKEQILRVLEQVSPAARRAARVDRSADWMPWTGLWTAPARKPSAAAGAPSHT